MFYMLTFGKEAVVIMKKSVALLVCIGFFWILLSSSTWQFLTDKMSGIARLLAGAAR